MKIYIEDVTLVGTAVCELLLFTIPLGRNKRYEKLLNICGQLAQLHCKMLSDYQKEENEK